MYKKILVPLDGSQRAEKILPHVIDMAGRYAAELVLLKVDEPEMLLGVDEVVDFENRLAERRRHKAETETYLAGVAQSLKKQGLKVRTLIAFGLPVKAILDTAQNEDAGLVAMASHGFGGQLRQFYGSTVAGVLQRIDRPLLLVRSRQA
jgi:nucleotide-binding universal stress UspA family protein